MRAATYAHTNLLTATMVAAEKPCWLAESIGSQNGDVPALAGRCTS